MAEKSCDVANNSNTNHYIKTDNADSNPDGGNNIKRVRKFLKIEPSEVRTTVSTLMPPWSCIFQFKKSLKKWTFQQTKKVEFYSRKPPQNRTFHINWGSHIGIFGFKTCIFFSPAVIASTNLSDLFSDLT